MCFAIWTTFSPRSQSCVSTLTSMVSLSLHTYTLTPPTHKPLASSPLPSPEVPPSPAPPTKKDRINSLSSCSLMISQWTHKNNRTCPVHTRTRTHTHTSDNLQETTSHGPRFFIKKYASSVPLTSSSRVADMLRKRYMNLVPLCMRPEYLSMCVRSTTMCPQDHSTCNTCRRR